MKPEQIFTYLTELLDLLQRERNAFTRNDLEQVQSINERKNTVTSLLSPVSTPQPSTNGTNGTNGISSSEANSSLLSSLKNNSELHNKIKNLATQVQREAKINASIASNRLHITQAKLDFISQQTAPSYKATGKADSFNQQGSLLNVST